MNEGTKTSYYFLVVGIVLLLVASYAVGFVIGKQTGLNEAKIKFENERKKLLRAIASMTPVSRPSEDRFTTAKELLSTGKVPVPEGVGSVSGMGELKEVEEHGMVVVKPSGKPVKQVLQVTPPEEPTQGGKEAVATVEQKESVKATTPSGNYYIQLGIFSKEANAEGLADKLKINGFEAMLITTRSGYYKVIVGYFQDKKEAMDTMNAIKDKLGVSGVVRKRKHR